jgi:hypothetical protein
LIWVTAKPWNLPKHPTNSSPYTSNWDGQQGKRRGILAFCIKSGDSYSAGNDLVSRIWGYICAQDHCIALKEHNAEGDDSFSKPWAKATRA